MNKTIAIEKTDVKETTTPTIMVIAKTGATR